MSAIGHLNGAKGTAPPAALLEITIFSVHFSREMLEGLEKAQLEEVE